MIIFSQGEPMIQAELTVKSEQGLHARPADLFVRTANKFNCKISIRNLTTESDDVNAKSILRILTLGVNKDHVIKVVADGDDEAEALQAISNLIDSNFQ